MATITAIEVRSAGNAGHGPVLDLRNLAAEVVEDHELLLGRYAHVRPVDLHVDAEALEGQQDPGEVLRLGVLDRDVPAADRRQADEAADLDVLGRQPPRAARELLHAADPEHVRLEPFDLGAKRDEEPAEILDVRLAGGVADHRLPGGERGSHDGVLGGHHARLVEEDVLALEAARAQVVARPDVDFGAELGQGVDVRIEPPPSDHVAAGRRRDGSAEAREEWPHQEEGGANLAPELAVELVAREVGGVDADLVPARPLNVRAELGEERDHRLDVADARHVRERHRFVGEQAGREDRQGAVLVPGHGDPAVKRMPALDHERLGNGFGDDGLRHARGYPSAVVEPTRERAWETLNRYTKSEALLRHALAVEAAVGAYAQRFEEDEELWRVTALLHDFDYEIHPTLDKHPQDGAPILREEGYPEEVIEGVLSHGSHLGLPRDTPLKKTLFACDELAGFVHACGLVRPDGIETLEPKSVKKKLKQPSFASGVNRADVYEGAEALGVELDEHIAFVVAAMRPIAGELGLPKP